MARPAFYQFVKATLSPTPGAMEYGFESEMLAFRPLLGPGIAFRRQLSSIGGMGPQGQNYQINAMNWLAGLSGVNHGQIVLQPLSDPYGG
jgi:hypothetical protein